jgi:hypothetical protein
VSAREELAAAVAEMGALPVPLGRIGATEKDTRGGDQPPAGGSTPAVPAAPLLVYRVDYDSHMKCGLYSNVEAAKAHCQGVVSDEYPADQALFFEWSVDEYDASVLELAVRLDDESVSTLYTVTTETAEHHFDPDAEW